ncbi:MAG: DUF5687 family protein [Bacteroidota bacterium]|nr:DUF5687 family protein [Bacteroidota bacterium]
MYIIFLQHQWKEFWRSRNKGVNIFLKIIVGFFILYFLVIAFAAGLFMDKIIHQILPKENAIFVFNGLIAYYFFADFLARLQLQQLPTLSIVPYLGLKIKRRKIVNFLNLKALFSPFNLIPLFILLPFCFTVILKSFGTVAAMMYSLSVLCLILLNNYLVLFLKRKSISNVMYVVAGTAIIGILALFEYYKVISIAKGSNKIFNGIVFHPLIAFGFTILAVIIFFINSRYLNRNLYLEELSKTITKKSGTDYPFLNRFGQVGELVALEIKLIIRNKRPRSLLLVGCFLMFYGFLFYDKATLLKHEYGRPFFAAFLITGIAIVNYGQLMFAWQSPHFDGLLANKISFKNFIKAKFLLFTLICSFAFLISCFYGFISWQLILLQLAAYLYNIGFVTVTMLYFATLNYKRIDLSKASRFNYEGSSWVQWVLAIPLMLIPVVLYLPFSLLHKPFIGIGVVGLFGLITLLLRNLWINLLVKKFIKQRYKIAAGFRE